MRGGAGVRVGVVERRELDRGRCGEAAAEGLAGAKGGGVGLGGRGTGVEARGGRAGDGGGAEAGGEDAGAGEMGESGALAVGRTYG